MEDSYLETLEKALKIDDLIEVKVRRPEDRNPYRTAGYYTGIEKGFGRHKLSVSLFPSGEAHSSEGTSVPIEYIKSITELTKGRIIYEE